MLSLPDFSAFCPLWALLQVSVWCFYSLKSGREELALLGPGFYGSFQFHDEVPCLLGLQVLQMMWGPLILAWSARQQIGLTWVYKSSFSVLFHCNFLEEAQIGSLLQRPFLCQVSTLLPPQLSLGLRVGCYGNFLLLPMHIETKRSLGEPLLLDEYSWACCIASSGQFPSGFRCQSWICLSFEPFFTQQPSRVKTAGETEMRSHSGKALLSLYTALPPIMLEQSQGLGSS